MRILILLSVAAIAAGGLGAPAAAADPGAWPASSFHDGHRDGGHRGDRHDGHKRHGGSSGFFVEYDAGAWALYNNHSWDPDSFNDWWHDRPDRAYPRWVQEQRRNATCDPDRMWWSGSGWHC
jgi:hypothetical protein